MSYKVFIPTKGRAKTMTTHKWLEASGVDYRILVNTDAERDEYAEALGLDKSKIVTTYASSKAGAMNFAMDTLTEKNEWYVQLDDVLTGMTAVEAKYYDAKRLEQDDRSINWSRVYSEEITATYFINRCDEMVAKAENLGLKYIGLAPTENQFFRKPKFRTVGYVRGEATILQNTGVKYNEFCTVTECEEYTAAQHYHYGGVLLNNFICPTAPHYVPGGLGLYYDRAAKRVPQLKMIQWLYPGFYRFAEIRGPNNHHPKMHIRVKFQSPPNARLSSKIKQWREKIKSETQMKLWAPHRQFEALQQFAAENPAEKLDPWEVAVSPTLSS